MVQVVANGIFNYLDQIKFSKINHDSWW